MKPSGDHLIISCLFRASLNALLSFFPASMLFVSCFFFLFCDSFVLQWSDGGAGVKPCHQNHVEICQAPSDGTDPLCPRLTCCQADHQKCESGFSPAVHQLSQNLRWPAREAAHSVCHYFHFFLWKQFAHVIIVGVDVCRWNPLEGQQSRMAWLQKRNRADCGGYHNADWRQFLQCYVSCAALPLKMWSGTKRETLVFPLWPNHLDPLYSALLLRLGP